MSKNFDFAPVVLLPHWLRCRREKAKPPSVNWRTHKTREVSRSVGNDGDRSVDDRNLGSRQHIQDLAMGVQLLGEGFDNGAAEPGLGAGGVARHADAVVGDGHRPAGTLRSIADDDRATAMFGEGVLKGVDYQFGDDQAEADGDGGT